MPDGVMRLVLGAILLLHGMGHGGAMGALWWVRAHPEADAGGWKAARVWAAPALAPRVASAVAVALWSGAMLAFVVAALGFWSVGAPPEWWRPAAVIGALISLLGIGLLAGMWPAFNTVAAVALNMGVLVAVIGLGWPAEPVST